MQSITQDTDQIAAAGAVEVDGLASRIRDAMHTVVARRHTRRVVQGMSETQLRDSGIDRAAVLGDRPVIDTDVRLATYLASLR
jgi:uncharacterized protein YjiS (DUF1127 family)